ncbi:MAG TPA: tyrosine-type recombinase/integrase [Rhizomicrobium sp.]|jgi:integrase
MAVRLIRRAWWVDLRFTHTRYRKRSPENTRSGAQAYEAVLRQRLARGEHIDGKQAKAERCSFADFAPRWFAEYVVSNNKPSEQRTKRYTLSASLIPFFGRIEIARIGVRDIERFKAEQIRAGVSRKTINNKLTILRKCLYTAYDWLALKEAPPKVAWLKCPPPRTDYLTPDECTRLLQHSDGVIGEMILTALRTGMRQGELKGLQWDSLDWLNHSMAVRHSYSDYTKSLGSPKGNRERHIPLDIDLYEVLIARRQEAGYVFADLAGRPFNHRKVTAGLAAVCRRAELRTVGWHTLRHTFASHLAMNGTPLNIVQLLLGHSTIAMTMRYAHVAPSALRTAIDLANPRTAYAANDGQQVGNGWRSQHQKPHPGVTTQDGKTQGICAENDLPLAA